MHCFLFHSTILFYFEFGLCIYLKAQSSKFNIKEIVFTDLHWLVIPAVAPILARPPSVQHHCSTFRVTLFSSSCFIQTNQTQTTLNHVQRVPVGWFCRKKTRYSNFKLLTFYLLLKRHFQRHWIKCITLISINNQSVELIIFLIFVSNCLL